MKGQHKLMLVILGSAQAATHAFPMEDAVAEQPSGPTGIERQSALNEYGNATQLTTLLAWEPRMLYVISNGRMGSLRFSGRREGKALASAAKVGRMDARGCGRDKFSPVAPADTAQIIAETSGDPSAEIDGI